MFVSVTLPQFVTTAVSVLGWPRGTVLQVLVTPMQGLSVTTQTLLAWAVMGWPQTVAPLALTVLGKLPQLLVTSRL
jgi:hypothetical protein